MRFFRKYFPFLLGVFALFSIIIPYFSLFYNQSKAVDQTTSLAPKEITKYLQVPGLNQSKRTLSNLSTENSEKSATKFNPETEITENFSYCAGLENYSHSIMRVKEITRHDVGGKPVKYTVSASPEGIEIDFLITFPIEPETEKISRCFSN